MTKQVFYSVVVRRESTSNRRSLLWAYDLFFFVYLHRRRAWRWCKFNLYDEIPPFLPAASPSPPSPPATRKKKAS